MKTNFKFWFLLWGFGVFAVTASGQTATITVLPTGSNQVQQGQTITLDVFVSNLPTGLRGYQCRHIITPQAGATGSLTLADTTVPNPGDPANTALFINEPGWNGATPPRADWVFVPPVPSQVFTAVNVSDVQYIGTLLSGTVGPFPVQKYLGTIILRASGTASGNFTVTLTDPNAVGASTFLRTAAGVSIPATVVGATVTVIPPGPTNDNCSASTTITNGVTNFSTVSATNEAGGPPVSGTCDEGVSGSIVNDVWFNYTATCSGIVTISTCNSASFDTRLVVYDGDANPACTCPSVGSPIVTCDDDAASCGNTAEVVFTATAGLCYKVRLGGDSGSAINTGTGSISVSCIDNDTCATAQVISGTLPQTRLGSTRNTNIDTGLPTCGPFGTSTAAGGVWYRVTGTGGLMTASLCGQTSYNSRLSVFSGACASLACVDAADNNCSSPNGNNETVSWCSNASTNYFILVHGGTNATGDFRLVVSNTSCNDNSACTTDACVGLTCQNTSTTPAGSCCNPSNGALSTIDDNNPCTIDTCNANGSVSRTPVPNGPNVACDDGFRCTLDQCSGGQCANTDINTLTCTVSANCPAGTGSTCVNNFCRCIENPTLDLVPDPGALPNPACFGLGDFLTVNVEMGFSPNPIVAAQMFLEYDPSTLLFVSMDPGRNFDITSPFSFELQQIVNPTLGTIDYAVAVPPGPGGGTANPALVAVIVFQTISECNPYVRFRSHTPATSLLDANATSFAPVTGNMPAIRVQDATPGLVSLCPTGFTVDFDEDEFSATLDYTTPIAFDSCDGSLPVTCDNPPGTAFPAGTTTVTCEAVNSCGVPAECQFDVNVMPSTMRLDVELSPTLVAAPRQRCITFDLWDCQSGRHATVNQTVAFSNGLASNVTVNIPGGVWTCVTARDSLHTLRSRAEIPIQAVDSRTYLTDFTGDLNFGGHWLLGGNLNDDSFIDIQDYVRFLQQYLAAPNPNTPCGTLPYHADINGSGTVDVADLSFIQVSMFESSEPECCGGTVASVNDEEPLAAISLKELREKGLGHLGIADFNGDDVLDIEDINVFAEVQPTFDPLKPDSRVPVLRNGLQSRIKRDGENAPKISKEGNKGTR